MKNVEVKFSMKSLKRVLALAVCGFAVCATLTPANASSQVQTPSDAEEEKPVVTGAPVTADTPFNEVANVYVTGDALTEKQVNYVTESIKTGKTDIRVNMSNVTEATAPADWFKAAQGNDVTLTFDFKNYTIVMNGKDITDPSIAMNLKATVDVEETATLKKQLPGTNMVIDFAHSGKLPGKTSVTVGLNKKYENGTVLYLYHINDDGSLEYINQDEIKVNYGIATFTIDHCSQYVLSTVAPAKADLKAPVKDSDSVIKDTGTANSGIALLTLVGCGAALAAVAGKKRKA